MADVSQQHMGSGNATTAVTVQQPPALQLGKSWVNSQEICAHWKNPVPAFFLPFLNLD